MIRSLLTIPLVLLAFASGLARAQGGVWTPVPVPGGPVYAVSDGDSGRVLVAGNTGAFRFDGFRMQKLPIFASGPDSLKGNAVLRARNGDIWFGALDGAYCLKTDGTVSHYDRTSGVGNNIDSQVTCLAEDDVGTIWAGTSVGGLSRFDGSSWSTITTDQGLPSLFVSSVAIDPADQSAWVGLTGPTGGLAHVVGGVVVQVFSSFSLTNNRNVRAVLVDPRGDVWFGIEGGIARLRQGSIAEFATSGSTVSSLARGVHGEFWFGTSNRGVGRLDNGLATFLPSGPPSSSINGLFVDAAGVLWASTSAGLGRYEGAAWLPASQAAGLPPGWKGFAGVRIPGTAAADTIDANGIVWLSTARIFTVPPDGSLLVRRVNGFDRVFGTADGLFSGNPYSLAPGDSGGVWVGSYAFGGVGSGLVAFGFDGTVRRTEVSSLPAPEVFAVCRAGVASAWAGTRLGVALVDPSGVRALPIGGAALPDAPVRGLDLDGQGRLWIATGPSLTAGDGRPGKGAVRFDPADSSWIHVTQADGLPSDNLTSVHVFTNGDVWFGTPLGAARWRHGAIVTLTAPALPSNVVSGVAEGANGEAWIATAGGLALLNGPNLSTFGVADGMSGPNMSSVFADDRIVISPVGTDGTNLFHPDRTPPRAEIITAPPVATGSRNVEFAVAGGDLDSDRGILLSSQLDGGSRTAFAPDVRSVGFRDLPDGSHTFRLWARDNALNETPDPTTWTFVVDATPPRPIVSKPAFNQVVKGTVDVVGSVADARFANYTIELRPQGVERWDTLLVATDPPASDTLYLWDTTANFDGVWELRVGSVDSLGLIGYVQVTTIVDNLAPNASVTAPAKVDHVLGGKVFTTDGGVEIDIPPNAFAADQIINIDPIAQPALPGGMPPGAIWGPSYLVHAGDMTLDKPATLTFRLDGIANTPAAIYRVLADTSVVPIGGQRTPDGASISTTLSSLGGVVVLFGQNVAAGANFDGVRGLDVQPRVLSPNGGGFDTRAAISFEAGKSGSGAVKVFDRAGRLVREVSENDSFAPGRNVVFWDGRDADGQVVPSGIYVVAVRFDGQTQVASIAVANR